MTDEVLGRPNLTVAVGTMTEKIVVESESRDGSATLKARGVVVSTTRNGQQFYVGASREVILCAGTIASPQLLMLSGIGPAEVLKRRGVPLVLDLPMVGRSLQDVSDLLTTKPIGT